MNYKNWAIEMIVEDSLETNSLKEDVSKWVDNFASYHVKTEGGKMTPVDKFELIKEILHQLPYYGCGMDCTPKSLVQFEEDFFSTPSKYPNLRYGQAFVNVFGAIFPNIYYESDTGICRSIVWSDVLKL